jgi:hypothetical protein
VLRGQARLRDLAARGGEAGREAALALELGCWAPDSRGCPTSRRRTTSTLGMGSRADRSFSRQLGLSAHLRLAIPDLRFHPSRCPSATARPRLRRSKPTAGDDTSANSCQNGVCGCPEVIVLLAVHVACSSVRAVQFKLARLLLVRRMRHQRCTFPDHYPSSARWPLEHSVCCEGDHSEFEDTCVV